MMAFADQQDERYTSKVIIIVVPREGETCPVGGQVGYEATEDGAEKLLTDVLHATRHYVENFGIMLGHREIKTAADAAMPLSMLMQLFMQQRGGPFGL